MPLPVELLNSASDERRARARQAAGRVAAHNTTRTEARPREQEIDRLVQAARAVAAEARDRDIPLDFALVSEHFTPRSMLRSGALAPPPISRSRKDVPEISKDGTITRQTPGRIRSFLGRPGKPEPEKRSVPVKGRIEQTPRSNGWLIFSGTIDRVRKVGIFLDENGRVGIFDHKSDLARLDPSRSHDPAHPNPRVLPLGSTIFARDEPEAEDGILYLDNLGYNDSAEIPAMVERLKSYDRSARPVQGLAVIESSLVNFIVNNSLDT